MRISDWSSDVCSSDLRILVAGSGLRRAPRIGSSHRRAAMTKYAGLDVSLEETAICIVDETGGIVREARVATEVEAIDAYLSALGVELARVGLEAGPLSGWLYAGQIGRAHV